MEKVQRNILQFRLEAARDAQKMSRLAFLVSTILSLAIIIATWNAYYSWNVHFPLQEKWHENEVTQEVQKKMIQDWAESSSISIPLLGIKVCIFDGSVFGSIGLLIIAIWFFGSIRRENYVIGFFLRDTKDMDVTHRKWIYHGITSYMVFAAITRRNDPIEDLHCLDYRHRPNSLMRLAFKIMVFLPSFAIAFIIISDILTVYILPAYYRYPHDPLFEHFGLFNAIQLTIMELFAFVLLILITVLYKKLLAYVESTTRILREYYLDCMKDIPGNSRMGEG